MAETMTMAPYHNEDIVLYMDELSGTNVVLQPLRSHGTGESTLDKTGAGTSRNVRLHNTAAPLLETDNDPRRNRAPNYGPEIDDLAGNKRQDGNNPGDRRTEDGSVTPGSGYPRRRFPFDVNIYQQKKTLAQGMMDLALISANANQFRYVLQSSGHPYYMASLWMIGTSLFLQVVVGVGLIWNSTYNVKKDTQVFQANKVNNLTIIGIFLVTILNVFITSFGVAEPTSNGFPTGDLKTEGNAPEVETIVP